VEDWLAPQPGFIARDEYAYDLIVRDARLENWHRHHGHGDHTHRGAERRPIARTTLPEAIDQAFEILYAGRVPDED
jgi:hypothetical protein